jgi:hypothetical protein
MYAGVEPRLDDTSMTGPGAPPARRPARVSKVRPAWLLLGCLLGFPPGSQGTEIATQMAVSARVLPHVRLEAPAARDSIIVTPTDLTRGYVEVSRHYRLTSNAPDRVLLQVNPRLGLTQAIEIEGLGPTLRLVDTGVEIAPSLASDLDLTFRLWLAPGVGAGEYPLPLQLAAVVR